MKKIEHWSQRAVAAFHDLLHQSREQMEQIKMRIAISSEEDKKRRRLQEIGELVCKRYEEGDSMGEEFDFIYGEIEMIEDEIKEMKNELKQRQQH